MEDNIFDLADKILNCIKESKVYNDYLDAKNNVEDDTEIMEKIKFYKIKDLEFQNKIIQNQTVSFDEEKYMSELYFNLMLNPKSKRFIESEKNMINLMGSIYERLSDCKIELLF